MGQNLSRLAAVAPGLERILARGGAAVESLPLFAESQILRETLRVAMRDSVELATDVYLPPVLPAPAVVMRTPYGRAAPKLAHVFLAFATRGYVVISQDCRGTGDSEPDVWDYCVYEAEDGIDFVDWVTRQTWFNGFLASFGGSYVGMTQWCMSAHKAMSAIAPEVAGLQVTRSTVRRHMFVNGYPRAVGKGANRLPVSYEEVERLIEEETMATGFFNEPLRGTLPQPLLDGRANLRALPVSEAKRLLWAEYCDLPAAKRATVLKQLLGVSEFSYTDYCSLPVVLDCLIPYGVHAIPSVHPTALCRRIQAPALILTGWYDWTLGDTLLSWATLRREGIKDVTSRSRLIITPAAHNMPGYHERDEHHPELQHDHRSNIDLLLRWYKAVRERTTDSWPTVIYYLMGANEWRVAADWPVPEARAAALYLGSGGALSCDLPHEDSGFDTYTYDPMDPTPTVGGSIVSFLYPPGSVDVSKVQRRTDVLTYTTRPFDRDFDVVGPLRLILYVSSSAVDTDFVGRVSDVFPDGRAIQLQNGILRSRYRNPLASPELLEPGRIYCLEIDLWATANRFKAGHRLRLDISSADFPRFDRNTNRGGEPGDPISARQTVYHDPDYPSRLLLSVLE